MIFLLLLPLILSLLLIIGFKKSGFVSGLIGVCSTLVISYMMESLQLDLGVLYNSLLNTIILTLSAFLVILPGLTLNNILEDHGYNRSLQGYLKEMPIDRNHKVMLLVFGLLPALESITGFGVSLILAVPVFISLLKQETALKVSMLSMNIMPWGTLGLATVVGSKISSQPIESLGFLTACMSLFVFIVLGGICSFVLNENEIKYKNFIFGISIASTISILLMIFNYMGQVEIAGVLSGLITFLIFFSFLLVKNNSSLISEYKNILMNISPYILVIIILVILKIIVSLFPYLIESTTFHGVGVDLVFIKSPFLAIVIAILLIMSKNKSTKISIPINKTIKACSTLFVFILLSQLMNFSQFIDEIVIILNSNENSFLYHVSSPLIGMLSGFITGSNLGGNALLMDMQSSLGVVYNRELLFSAIQNASAGFAVFTSVPIIVLILTLAKNTQKSSSSMEQVMLRFGLKCLVPIYFSIVLAVFIIGNLSF